MPQQAPPTRAEQPPSLLRISRVDQTAPGLWSVTLRPVQVVVVILAVRSHPPAVAFLEHRPQGEQLPADAQVRLLRDRLEEGTVLSLRTGPEELELQVVLQDMQRVLRADRNGIRILEGEGNATLAPVPIPSQGQPLEPIPTILQEHARALLALERRQATTLLRGAQRKLRQRLGAIEEDNRRAKHFEQEADRVRPLVAEAARSPRGSTLLQGTDWSTGSPEKVVLEIDPARPARDQIEEVFARSRRMKRGEPIRRQRLQQASEAQARLQQALLELEHATTAQSVRETCARALAAMPVGIRPRRERSDPAVAPRRSQKQSNDLWRKATREYRSADGTVLLVGRDAKSNDVLTTRIARPSDLWMHARGYAGSHVVVRAERGKTPSPEALLDGATLAVYFSEARGQSVLEVDWCERRYVRKPKGAAPGLVTLLQAKTLRLRFERDRLERLLATLG